MNKTLIVVIALVVVGFLVYLFIPNNKTVVAPIVPTTTTTGTPITATSGTPPTAVAAPTSSNVSISIKDFAFNPNTLNIKTGTKVTWTNNDSVPHTINSDSGSLLKSGTIAQGQSWSFTFSKTGTADYHCSIHPMMKGQIVVTN